MSCMKSAKSLIGVAASRGSAQWQVVVPVMGRYLGVSVGMGVPQNEWFLMENLSVNGWFLGNPISGNLHLDVSWTVLDYQTLTIFDGKEYQHFTIFDGKDYQHFTILDGKDWESSWETLIHLSNHVSLLGGILFSKRAIWPNCDNDPESLGDLGEGFPYSPLLSIWYFSWSVWERLEQFLSSCPNASEETPPCFHLS